MDRSLTGQEGVVVYRGVPVVDVADQQAPAYLHLRGLSRDLPSHVIRVYLGDDTVSAETGREHPAFVGDAMTYNSPPVPGRPVAAAAGRPLGGRHGSYDVLIDLSETASRAPVPSGPVDVTLVVTDLDDIPLDVSSFVVEDLVITRHAGT